MTWVLLSLLLAIAGDDVRLRLRGRKRDRKMLNEVDGVYMPEPDDPRWVNDEVEFSRAGVGRKEGAMRLGQIYVDKDGWVFIRKDKGLAEALPGSQKYGRAVWRAFNAKRALEAMLS